VTERVHGWMVGNLNGFTGIKDFGGEMVPCIPDPWEKREPSSPSPQPSPLGRGRRASSSLEIPERLDLSARGQWFSLSPRERAGVRGKETAGLRKGHEDSTPPQNRVPGQGS
jgi:hypothetical protein